MKWNNGSNEVIKEYLVPMKIVSVPEIAWQITSFRSACLLSLWLFQLLALATLTKSLDCETAMKDYIICCLILPSLFCFQFKN